MAFELNIGAIMGDFARANLFEVEIPFLGRDFKFKCKAATLPNSTVEKVPVSYQNRKINIGGDREFDDWVLTVYNDTGHIVRDQFLAWSRMVHQQDRRIYGDAPEDYKKDGYVRQYDRKNVQTAQYLMKGIWPTIVGEIQLDWDTNNEVETFEVTLAIDWWEPASAI
ncbi:tail tube protein [Pseudomonas phage Astolliot]|nr:tail tube protein [Pseudomonas phage Astolliot]